MTMYKTIATPSEEDILHKIGLNPTNNCRH